MCGKRIKYAYINKIKYTLQTKIKPSFITVDKSLTQVNNAVFSVTGVENATWKHNH